MRALITGATGFLGGALARRLHQQGWDVLATGRSPEAGRRLAALGIRFEPAALEDQVAMRALCRGRQVVFHCGALSAPWGRRADFYRANVEGTAAVLEACQAADVGRLVHVSTPSLYFRYDARLNVREDAPLPARQINAYTQTKLLAEGLVQGAAQAGLSVITLRPRAIYGPGDRSILPRLIARLAQGRLPVIGDGQNLADLTYIDDAVQALILAAQAGPACAGRVYNISGGQPVRLWDVIGRLCQALNLPYPRRRIGFRQAFALAAAMEAACSVLPGQPEPPLTRYGVCVLALDATLNIEAAQRDLGYQPQTGIEAGLAAFAHAWRAGQA